MLTGFSWRIAPMLVCLRITAWGRSLPVRLLITIFAAAFVATVPAVVSAGERPESPTRSSSSPGTAQAAQPPSLGDLAITVTTDHPREFIFTDKGAAHLAGEAVGTDTRSYHGFYVAMHEVLDGWALRLEDGTLIGPDTAIEAEVRPDRLQRVHRTGDGETITETVTLFDRANGFRVVYDGVPPGRFAVLPRVDMRFLWRVGKPAYRVDWRDGVLLIAREDALGSVSSSTAASASGPAAPADPAPPAWLAVAVSGAAGFEPDGRYVDTTYPKGAARKAMDRCSPYLPGAITGHIPPRIPSGTVAAYFAAAATADEALAAVRRLRAEAFTATATREQRLTDLLARTHIATGNDRDDRALAWARISLDNLIMEQRGVGIYAGFYWFTTYWGRDTFITLPGACITSGDFATAATILRSFAAWQDTDRQSPREGRLPNFVTVDQVQFAGIDGTWWFVRALDELWRRSGDDRLARELAPVVVRAVEGALRHAVDEHGFLTHGDGETWMDAGGEANPYSPRGDRAVEVQALFHRGLLTAARLVERCGAIEGASADGTELAARYRALADTLAASFTQHFWHGRQLVDHLNADGSPDLQKRPNGLLALLASPTLFSAGRREAVADLNAEHLAYPWGVLSLSADDPAFHPRHLDLANYYYDEAYHNGDIWLWLSGAYVSALPDPRAGFGQTRMLLDEILDEGAVGTLQEIRDGARAASNDEFGGATSQAWSLSELLRTISDDYLGLRVDLTADPPRVEIRPRLPERWTSLSVRTRLGPYDCRISCVPGDVMLEVLSEDDALPAEWDIVVER